MHFTGTIWRPPYESGSLLIEATAGCTHHRCKFCTLYDDLPFAFRMSPLEDIEADLQEAQLYQTGPLERLGLRLQGLGEPQGPRRAFLTGANPFVLKTERLEWIAELIRTYFPQCGTIGCFARITDVTAKTDQELVRLARAGYDGVTIGVETGDGESLAFMDKEYGPEDILTQTRRLDAAGIGYHFFYLAGIAGAGKGGESAVRSAGIFNQTHPERIGSSMLTVFPESRLYQEIQAGNWREAGEREKMEEVRTLVEHLDIPVIFAALGASNAVDLEGRLPEGKETVISQLNGVLSRYSEADLRRYREQLPHL
ncbi:MAG: radical SAM protein [Oscillibacter sp.]|nr:radical SAM protein [Oscillibacter sp.]